ncbi:MAG TPA: acyl-CoA reductase [Solirubrobacterales bacterium]
MSGETSKLWYLPPGVPEPPSTCTGGVARLDAVTPELVREAANALDAAVQPLAQLPLGEIIAAIDRVIGCWQAPCDLDRLALLEHGPAITGYSEAALRHAVDTMLNAFCAEGLSRLVREELGDAAALDRFVAAGGALRMARGPGRQFHVFAGGVPTVPVFSLICALLLKSPVLAKPSNADQLVPALFARTLARVEPRLARALAVLPWRGGDTALEAAALDGAGAVVVYGSDETVAAIRRQAPPAALFAGYGHGLSFAAVSRESLTCEGVQPLARRLAWDTALFDQHGCLSPQFAAIERGGEVAAEEFAVLVAAELEALAPKLPRGHITPAEAARIQSRRELARFQAAGNAGVRVWQSPNSTEWTVVLRDRLTPAAGRDRFLTIIPVEDLATALPALSRGLPISSIGVAAPPQRLQQLAPAIAPLARRICPLGRMGEPPVTWRHDGRKNLEPLVTWVDLESC